MIKEQLIAAVFSVGISKIVDFIQKKCKAALNKNKENKTTKDQVSILEQKVDNKTLKNAGLESLSDFFQQYLKINTQALYLEDEYKKFKVENVSVFEEKLIEKHISDITENKSVLLSGVQGSGKTTHIKKMMNHIKEKYNYKICFIKTWDYDFNNDPLSLFMKKILKSNILTQEYQDALLLLIWLYDNDKRSINMPNHMITDIIKDFFKIAEIKNKAEKLIIFIDELERCSPAFAAELLETITTYAGIECAIDTHACEWDNQEQLLLINSINVAYSFDKEFIASSLTLIYGDYLLKNSKKFWKKYIKYNLQIDNIQFGNFYNILHQMKLVPNATIADDPYHQNQYSVIDTNKICFRTLPEIINIIKKYDWWQREIYNGNRYEDINISKIENLVINKLIYKFSNYRIEYNSTLIPIKKHEDYDNVIQEIDDFNINNSISKKEIEKFMSNVKFLWMHSNNIIIEFEIFPNY